MRFKKLTFMLMAVLVSCGVLAQNPAELWKDFDPNKGDFKEKIIKEETKGGIYYKESYISAYLFGEEIRVYCSYAVKAGAKKAPGLFNIHGWMSTAHLDRKYINDGWAVMSYDYCGKGRKRKEYTKYPEKLSYGNMTGYRVKDKLPNRQFITDPKQTDDYLWYVLQRRVLSYFLMQKEVDKDRIGAKGYSYGGTIIWNLGMDPRVKAIVAFFGIGWLQYYRSCGVWMYNVPPKNIKPNPGDKLYLEAIAPQAHAPYITAPSLWLNGTNDHHGGHERGIETFKTFKKGTPWAYALQARGHHNTEKLGDDCKIWLEKYVLGKDHFWPAQPKTEIRLDAKGVPELVLSTTSQKRITKVNMYYALKNAISFGRAWRDAKFTKQGDKWIAKMPVLNVNDYVFGFANISYDNNTVVSSNFSAAIPSKLGKAIATDKKTNSISEGTAGWSHVAPVEGVGGIKGFRVLNGNRGTLNGSFNDPKFKAPKNAQLSFMFYCTQPQTVKFTVNHHNVGNVKLGASNEWQTMTLPATIMINKYNKSKLPNWDRTTRVALHNAPGSDISKVVFANFKWVVKKAAPEKAKPITASADGKTYLSPAMINKAETKTFIRVLHNATFSTKNKILIGDKEFKKGLGVHAPSKVVFPLDGTFKKFHVTPGPTKGFSGNLEMKILVDDKEVYKSGIVNGVNFADKVKALDIPVEGAKKLTLIVTDGGNGNGNDRAAWGEAYLTK